MATDGITAECQLTVIVFKSVGISAENLQACWGNARGVQRKWKNVIMAEKAMRSHLTVLLEELKNLQQNRILHIGHQVITTMPVITQQSQRVLITICTRAASGQAFSSRAMRGRSDPK
jgi:hypothetical protein